MVGTTPNKQKRGSSLSLKLIILGPPGSGKGTMAEKLCSDFSLFHLSPGEILRDEVMKNTVLGSRIKGMVQSGKLVPAELVVEMVKLVLGSEKKYLLDGFPRSVEQAKLIHDFGVDFVILLDASEDAIVARLRDRRVCSKGIHGYHLKNLPPKKAGVCDVDGTPLVCREDDKPAVIRKRFEVYRKETIPVIAHYAKLGKVISVDAITGEIDDVYARVCSGLAAKGIKK